MQTRGEGVKNPENFADVICTCPLTSGNRERKKLSSSMRHLMHAANGASPREYAISVSRSLFTSPSTSDLEIGSNLNLTQWVLVPFPDWGKRVRATLPTSFLYRVSEQDCTQADSVCCLIEVLISNSTKSSLKHHTITLRFRVHSCILTWYIKSNLITRLGWIRECLFGEMTDRHRLNYAGNVGDICTR